MTASTMTPALSFSVSTTPFDDDYTPSSGSRVTTNFANLARGEHRRENLRRALAMIDRRCNALADWDNPEGDRYAVELEIVSVELHLGAEPADRGPGFPLIEILDVQIVDRARGIRVPGIAGNNLSSYVRDYDFSVLLPKHAADGAAPTPPSEFGELHGLLFRSFVESEAYRSRFAQPPVVCISVSTRCAYRRTGNEHPVLGVEYRQDAPSLTDEYFARMGLAARYFMPRGSVAPLAFYHRGDLLNDYSALALIGTVSTMETFQKIYRPEIYNANAEAGHIYRPSLEASDFSLTGVGYDREERSRLGITQGRLAQEQLLVPHGALLARWAASERARRGEPEAGR